MLETTILQNLEKLPEPLKQEVLHYVEYLVEKHSKTLPKEEPPKKRRQAGTMKGMFTISDDFDEPLEEMKDYM